MENSYKVLRTFKVQPRFMYQKDFTNPGQFEEEVVSDEINLLGQVWSGVWNGRKWLKSDDSENESCAIFLYYYNKNNIEIIFDSSYGTGSNLEPSFEFLEKAARKFFLVNDFFYQIKKDHDLSDIAKAIFPPFSSEEKSFAKLNPGWNDVKQLIAKEKERPADRRRFSINSWRKVMTIDEAKELFKFLKIKIDFPD